MTIQDSHNNETQGLAEHGRHDAQCSLLFFIFYYVF